jgi:regulator of PEP synthase PpsR (kinase-PPPase family)
MNNTYQIFLISDSTGETLDRIFLSLKAQFQNIEYKVNSYSFTRTENQVLKILDIAENEKNSIILYTIVDNNLAKFLANKSNEKKIPCFGVLGSLILSFSKLFNQKASHEPSGQHVLNEEYYDRIEAIQYTMNHDDGNLLNDIDKSDIILLGVSRTSKTPTSIYLANKGYKTANIPLVNQGSVPEKLKINPQNFCIVGLTTEAERLVDIRKNRMNSLKENTNQDYTDLDKIKKEVQEAKDLFKKYSWPTIDVTRKSVEETAASIIKIHEIYLNKKNG